MKKNFLIILFFQCCVIYSQTEFLSHPNVWLRADSLDHHDMYWNDISGQNNHAFFSNGVPDTATLNFHPCLKIDSISFFEIPHIQSSDKFITTIIVYKTSDSMTEQGIWSCKVKERKMGLTSRRIINDEGNIHYSDKNNIHSIVNSLSEAHEQLPDDSMNFKIGYCDSLYFSGIIAEFVFFNRLLDNNNLTKWLSYLAIKYGITLHQTNYLSSMGDTIWDYDNFSDYSVSIGGIGRDSIFGLHQKQTSLFNEKIIMGSHESLHENDFIVMGCDESLLSVSNVMATHFDDSICYYGDCMVQVCGTTARQTATFLSINASDWKGNLEQYRLLINRQGNTDFFSSNFVLISPTNIDTINRVLYFSGIFWDTDGNGKDFFRFIYYNHDEGMQPVSSISQPNAPMISYSTIGTDTEDLYLLYPNPNFGNFSLKIDLKAVADIRVRILTANGQVVDIINGFGQQQYFFHQHLFQKGLFFIEVNKGNNCKILKMVVQ